MKVFFAWCISMCLVPLCATAQPAELEATLRKLLEEHTQADSEGYSLLPPGSRLVQLKARDHKLSILLDISPAFLENEFDELAHEHLIEEFGGALAAFDLTEIQLKAKDKSGRYVDLSSFLDAYEAPQALAHVNRDPLPAIKGRRKRHQKALKNPVRAEGMLTGKTVWLSAGHGWHHRRGGISTQRGNSHGLVEDFATAEFVNYHLLKYLHQAGANVWTVRERDMNQREVIVRSSERAPAYREKGRWKQSRSKGYKGEKYRFAISSTKETATASFRPYIPESGLYWVSVQYLSGVNRTVDARYRIEHAGGVSEISVNQETHGSTWVYLGQFYFEKGRKGGVVLSNCSSENGQAVIADAVRFGGGVGKEADCYGGKGSGAPRFEESARYYAHYQGYPKCANDVVIRPSYAEWELSKGTAEERRNAVYLSLHTNANGPGGTESYIHTHRHSADARRLQASLHDQLIKDLRMGWRKDWKDRGRKRADFGELRALKTMPGVLLELAFHDHRRDAQDLSDPRFRQLAARAIYKGMVRYFAQKENKYPVYLPEPPTHLYAQSKGGKEIQVAWKAPLFGGHLGSKASSYKVYISRHGKAFADFETTRLNKFTFQNLQPSTTYYIRVAALNKGGESFPSAVVAVRTPSKDKAGEKLLIVDGFDRLDRGLTIQCKHRLSHFGRPQLVRRVFLDQMNHYDYMAEHAQALEQSGLPFDGASNESVADRQLSLDRYKVVNWYVGRESTTDQTLSRREQAILSRYLRAGGNLIISGSELGFDLAQKGNGSAFFRDYLKAGFLGDDAGHAAFRSVRGAGFGKLNGEMDNRAYGLYPLRSADVVEARNGSRVVLRYPDGRPAALSYNGDFGLVYFAFPLETVAEKSTRSALMSHALASLEAKKEAPFLARLPARIRHQLHIRMASVPEGRATFRFFNLDGKPIKEHQWKHYSRKKETISLADLPPDLYTYELEVLGRRQRGTIKVD